MRRPRLVLAAAVTLAAGVLVRAGAATSPVGAVTAPGAAPAGAISGNVHYVTTLPELASAISINFIGDTMFVSTQTGLFSYDVTDPRAPKRLGALPEVIWENEDVDVDAARHLVFISRDPRPAPEPSSSYFPKGTIEVVDVTDPRVMLVKSVIVADAWHTTTCVNHCHWLWSGGPFAFHAPVAGQPADWNGRPIFGTDLRDPAHPKPCPAPIDLYRNDGKTDYAHDVQVDENGVAWTSGFGGVRGYWTSGRHRNPVTHRVESADGCHPVPYAGGGTELGHGDGIMHNSRHNPRYAVDGRRGDLLVATEEDTVTNCAKSGRAATYDLRGSYSGAGFAARTRATYRLKELSTWTPEEQAGASGCDSAHYFSDRGDGVLAWAFYSQGTRFLDVSDPHHIRQIGYYRPNDATTWAAYWHKGYLFIADNSRGVDIVQFGGAGRGRSPRLVAPARRPAPGDRMAFRPNPAYGWLCRIPRSV